MALLRCRLALVGIALFAVVGLVDLIAALFFAPWEIPGRLHSVAMCAAVVMTITGAIADLKREAIAPVRQAFLHGYKLAMEHVAAQRDTGGAEVLRLPSQAYTTPATRPRDPLTSAGRRAGTGQPRPAHPR